MKFYLHKLTDEQQEIFEKKFYQLALFDDRFENSTPWGRPWLWIAQDDFIEADTIEQAAKLFYIEIKDDAEDQVMQFRKMIL